MTVTREFAPADRYLYDFKLTTERGWAQIDTRQDASYFGTWVNPKLRTIFCYCEGDTTFTECTTDEELREEIARMTAWNIEQGYRSFSNGKPLAIDPGFSEELKSAFVSAGLAEYLH